MMDGHRLRQVVLQHTTTEDRDMPPTETATSVPPSEELVVQ